MRHDAAVPVDSPDPAALPIMTSPYIVEIRTTFSTRAAAVACAERLVTAGLAACVQVDGPITSVYRWGGGVETAEEWRCVCKTTAAVRDACLEEVSSCHAYQTPELIVSDVAASMAYGDWVRASVSAERQPPADGS